MAVRLTDVYPDGRSMLVTDGIQRMRFRAGNPDETLMTPGQVYSVDVKLSITAQTFRQGHRIRLIVSSSNYPRFDVNPDIDRPGFGKPKSRVATNRIYFDREHPSELRLPYWAGVQRIDPQLLQASMKD